MRLAIGLTCVSCLVCVRLAHADCDQSPAKPATIQVYDCRGAGGNADNGVVITGTVGWKEGGTDDTLRLWVPGSEMLGCSKLLEPGQLAANVEKVCCEPNTGAVCDIGANAIVSKAKVVPLPPVKKASRAQLESEVVKLRAENAKLRGQVYKFVQQLRAENERLRHEAQELGKKLK